MYPSSHRYLYWSIAAKLIPSQTGPHPREPSPRFAIAIPGFWFTFHPYNDYGKMQLSEFFESVYLSRVPDTYRIYLHSAGEQEFNIIVVESQGDMMIPTEWAVMKSWNNGKVNYDKKALKNLTPEQAREKTSAHRIISTRQFEPYE